MRCSYGKNGRSANIEGKVAGKPTKTKIEG